MEEGIRIIGDEEPDRKGLVFLLIGEGKGKTTAALGMSLRANGWNQPLIFIQFMKKRTYGEINAFEKIGGEGFEIYQMGCEEHCEKGRLSKEDLEMAGRALKMAKEAIESRQYDWIFLDEAMTAMDYGLITENDLVNLIKERPTYLHLVLTGRGESPKLTELADCVTRMVKVKHHYDEGIKAQKGVEF